jgi:hypothetical protein
MTPQTFLKSMKLPHFKLLTAHSRIDLSFQTQRHGFMSSTTVRLAPTARGLTFSTL